MKALRLASMERVAMKKCEDNLFLRNLKNILNKK
jgi:hypothetical protein